jgi:hypothetical protein
MPGSLILHSIRGVGNMKKDYSLLNENTMNSIKFYPELKERWMDNHNDRVRNDVFSDSGHLSLERVLDIFEGLAAGKAYKPKGNKDGWYHMRGDVQINREGKSEPIIRWTNHGSSANKMTLDDLFWVIHVIFEGTDFEEFDWNK